MARLTVKQHRLGVCRARLATRGCCGDGGDTDPPPPIGCCVEFVSVACDGRIRRCRGGKDVQYRRETVSESEEFGPGGFRFYQRRTELILMRATCNAAGVVVITADLANSYRDLYTERTGQAPTYSRVQPLPSVPASTFRTPGNTPLVADGADPRPCDSVEEGGGERVVRHLESRCYDGLYLETRNSTVDANNARTSIVWSWIVAIECQRPPGPGLLPPGIDPATLRPPVPGCPGCGH